MANIVVVGSINMDIVNHVKQYPLPGETVPSTKTMYNPGGKGANQAIAARLAGGKVTMIGAVGTDSLATKLLSNLENFGLNTTFIMKKEGTSGTAFITVDQSGENHIILSKGSNGKLEAVDLTDILSHQLNEDVDAVLLQNEIPWDTTQYVIQKAYHKGIKVVVNPAPAIMVPENILPFIHLMIANETEAGLMTQMDISDQVQAVESANRLVKKGVAEMIITLGGQGSIYVNQSGKVLHTPAFKVKTVDTTAAGDAFTGAFITADRLHLPVEDSLRFATAASAITVMHSGAQRALPNRRQIEQFLHVCYNERNV